MFKPHTLVLGLVLLILIVGAKMTVWAQDDEGLLILDDPHTSYPVGLHLEYLEDLDGNLTIDDVTQPEFTARFTTSQEEILNFGTTESVYWFSLHVRNETGEASDWRLAFSNNRVGLVDFYVPSGGDSNWVHQQAGTYLPVSVRQYAHPHIVFPLSIPTSEEANIYLRLESNLPIRLSVSLWPAELFEQQNHNFFGLIGFFYGGAAIIVVYTLLLFFSTRKATYLYLSMFVAFYVLNTAASDGSAQLYLYPDLSFKNATFGFATVAVVFAILFNRSFLELKQRLPWLNWLLGILAVIEILAFVLYAAYPPGLILGAVTITLNIMLATIFTILGAIVVWRQGLMSARYFLLGWLTILLNALFLNSTNLALIQGYQLFDVGQYIGTFALVILLSLAMSDQLIELRRMSEQAERARIVSEERFRHLFERAPMGIFIADPTGRIEQANSSLREMFGYSEQELTRMAYLELIHPDERTAAERNFKGLIEEQKASFGGTIRGIRNDGSPFWIWRSASALYDDAGKISQAFWLMTDVTERMEIEQRIRESEERFRAIFEQAAVGIAHEALDGTYLLLNQKFCDIVGYSHEEMLARTFRDITHPDDLDADLEHKRQLLAGQIVTYTMEKRYFKKDGQIVWINLTVSLVQKMTGEPDYFVVVVEDITARKQAEEALLERKERYWQALGSGQIMLWQWDMATDHMELDGPVEQMLGYALDEIDTTAKQAALTPLEDQAALRKAWGDLLEGRNENYSVVHRFLHKDGSVIWVEAKGSAVKDEQGQIIGILGMTRDITAIKRAEELVARSQAVGQVGSWELDLTSNQLTWSEEVYHIFGLDPGTVVPTYEAFLDHVHPEDRAAVDEAYSGSIREGKDSYEVEHRLVRSATGEIRWVFEKCDHIRDDSGQIVRSIGVVQDITERRRTEEALYQSREQLAILNRASQTIISAGLDSEQVYTAIRATCAWLIPADVVAISLVDQAAGEVEDIFLMDRDRRLPGRRYPLKGSFIEEILHDDKKVIVYDDQATPTWPDSPSGVRSGMAVPLQGSEVILGALRVQSYAPDAYKEINQSILETFTSHIAITLENLKHYRRLTRSAVIEERQRLASELHDSVTQLLYSISMMSAGWGLKASKDQLQDPAENFHQIEELSLQALKEMRMLIHQLGSPTLVEVGLLQALEDRLAKVENRVGIESQLQVEGILPNLPPAIEEGIYFIILEALNNSLRHARADKVQVNFEVKGKQLHISVEDDGRGYDTSRSSKGMGTTIADDRARTIGARIIRHSEPGKGTRIEIVLGT